MTLRETYIDHLNSIGLAGPTALRMADVMVEEYEEYLDEQDYLAEERLERECRDYWYQ